MTQKRIQLLFDSKNDTKTQEQGKHGAEFDKNTGLGQLKRLQDPARFQKARFDGK